MKVEDKEQLNYPMNEWQISMSLFIMVLLHSALVPVSVDQPALDGHISHTKSVDKEVGQSLLSFSTLQPSFPSLPQLS